MGPGATLARVQGTRMVPVLRATDGFHARVVAARLGSEGMITSFRGGGIDGPYPLGAVEVLVREADLENARELLLADEVESAFPPDEDEFADEDL
jgi:Putative prokaryotic signal transducing protein